MKKNNLAKSKHSKWGRNISNQRKSMSFPSYPNEAMLKIIFGGRKYFNFKKITKKSKVLDIGCGMGNNLIPFNDIGCQTYGVDVHLSAINAIKNIDFNKKNKFFVGHNRKLPFEENFFDLILSINTIHYEENLNYVVKALKEFKRVLRPGGSFFLSTVANKHIIRTRADKIGSNVYKIKKFGIRNNTKMFFFNNRKHIKLIFERNFNKVRIGRITEDYENRILDFFVVTGIK